MTQPTQSDEPKSDWDTARDRAAMLRLWRTQPSDARRRANTWLAPVLAALWIVSITAHLLATLDTHAQDTLRIVGSMTALVLIIVGIIWLFVGGLFNLSNVYESPWTPLTKSDRRDIRHQLAHKAPLEFQHADVVLELAYQRRRQIVGSLVIIAIELPNSIGIALSDPDAVTLSLASASLLLFLALGNYCIAVASRLTTPIRQLTQAAAESAPG